jgi:uncharacterized OB-fold protein
VSSGVVARDDNTAAFFDGTASGQFLLRRCEPDGHLSRPQARQCSTCGTTNLHWSPASGRARLVSWAVIPARRSAPGDTPVPPTVVAIAELDEGLWWWSQIVDTDPDALAEGQRLQIRFEAPDGGEAVPVFGLA